MKQLPLIALLALPPEASAGQAKGPLCRDGKPPAFTGHPFRPFLCANEPSAQAAKGEAPVLSSAPIETPDKAKRTLEQLVGRWEGLAVFGGTRFLYLWDVKKGWFGSYEVDFTSKDYYLGTTHKFHADLKSRGGGRYQAKVRLESLPGQELTARILVGLAPPAGAGEEPFERQIDVVYEGGGAAHRLRFSPAGADHLHSEYTDLSQPTLRFGADLSRSQKTAL